MPKKKQNKNILHKTERDILILFNRSMTPFSINQVAGKLNISYMTAKKYVKSLLKKNLIREYGK